MKPIDLGKKHSAEVMPASPKDSDSKMHYPCVYIDLDDKQLADLPDEGTMTVKFKTVSRSTNERDGKKSSSLSLDVLQILDVTGEEPKEKSGDEELEELAKEETTKSKKSVLDEDEEDNY